MDTDITKDISLLQSDKGNCQPSKPFFSIGVTTYNRRELLKQTLDSILNQTFLDFEVIVGNDYTQELLSAELLGIDDSRIRFVNYPQNLREVGNMNSLLKMANGKYFTWLSDDDVFAPNFLEVLHQVLNKFDLPPCAFTAFETILGTSYPNMVVEQVSGREHLFTGRQFLRTYLDGKIKIIGPYGVFETQALREIGGIEQLCDALIGLYGEYMLLVRSGLLRHITYVDSPLVYYRAHEDSFAWKVATAEQYKQAGENLVGRCVQVLSQPELADDFVENLLSILNLVLSVYLAKLPAGTDYRKVRENLFSLHHQFDPLRGTTYYWKAIACFVLSGMDRVDDKRLFNLPAFVVKVLMKIRSFFPKPRQFWG